jgi:hypothetical protein
MNTYHKDPRFVGADGNSIIQTRFYVHGLFVNHNSEIVVELVQVRPFLTRFWHLVYNSAGCLELKHQASNFFQRDVAQLSTEPSVGLFSQRKLDEVSDMPIAKRVSIGRKSIGVSQGRQYESPRLGDLGRLVFPRWHPIAIN